MKRTRTVVVAVAVLLLLVGFAAASAAPDLTVVNVHADRTNANAGERIAVSADVLNEGALTAGTSRLKYYFSTDALLDGDDRYLNYDNVGTLAGGAFESETANVRIPSGTADGAYFVLLVADYDDDVVEVDELDNVFALAVTVGDLSPLPDLVLEDVTMAATSVRAGETVAVSSVARNAGAADAVSARLIYFLSTDTVRDGADKQLSYDSLGALAAGATSAEDASLRVTAATDAGAYFILFVVDADDSVAESDEDNVVALPLLVTTDDPTADKADLVLSGAALGATTVEAGEQVAGQVTVRNDGSIAAESSRLKYYLSEDTTFDAGDAYLNYDNVGELTVGATSFEEANLRIPAVTSDGDWFILFVADETREVEEQYESNNVAVVAVTVGEATTDPQDDPDAHAADYMVTQAGVDASSVRAGERASLTCVVENVGSYDATDASRVKYYLSRDTVFDANDDYVGYDNVPALSPGQQSAESATPRIPEETSHGLWHLLVVADAADDVAETFESNNVASIAIDVVVDDPSLDAADLLAENATTNKSTVGDGYKLDIAFDVRNAGTQPAIPSRVKLYLSDDAQHDEGDTFLNYRALGDMATGETVPMHADVRIPMLTPDGPAFVLLVVDSERQLTERYESNNVLPVAIEIGADTPDAFPYACPASVFTDPSLLESDTVATLNALHLGYENNKDMTALACIVSHYDLVGLVEIDEPSGVADLEAELELLTGDGWSHHVSATPVGYAHSVEYYGYVWRDAEVTFVASRGFYDDVDDDIKREPYGADFRMGAFDFTLVLFHLQYGNTISTRRHEAAQLIHVYDYFQSVNGAEQDVLIGGDFNLPGDDAAFTLVGHDGIDYITDPEQLTSIGYNGLASSFDNIFFSSAWGDELIGSGAHDYTMANWPTVLETVTDHIPVWAAFDTSVDDD